MNAKRKSILKNALLAMLFVPVSSWVSAAEQCPQIDCDCSSLPTEKWTQVCQQYETIIKAECVANANTPKSYCSIHGENATPVALSLSLSKTFNPFDVDKTTEDTLEDKIKMASWSLEADLGTAKKMLEKKQYSRTMQILKLIDSNADKLFDDTEQLEYAIRLRQRGDEDDKQRDVEKAWGAYAEKLAKVSIMYDKFARALEVDLKLADSEKQKKIYSVFTTHMYRVAGKTYEQAGYAFGKAKQHESAANQWRVAADLSSHMAEFNEEAGADASSIQYNQLQAAARLQRASYHRMMQGDAQEFANELLKESQIYVNREEQKRLQILIETRDEMVATGG